MKSTKIIFNVILMASLLFIYSCGGNTEPAADTTAKAEVSEAGLLLDHFEANKNPMTLSAEEGGFPKFISAQEVNDNLGGYIAILDLRGGQDFADGHIEGAINVKTTNMATFMAEDFNPEAYDKVVIVCYSGQTSSYVTAILNLQGFSNVYSMKWGMAAWNKKFAYKWQDNLGDKDAAMFETTENPIGAAGELPKLATGKTTGEEIAAASAAKLFEADFNSARVKWEDVSGDLSKYYIMSIQSKEHYDANHLKGAVWYDAKTSFGKDMKLNTLPTDKPIIVYCYSGMNAAFTVAYLRMLGYDAYILLYGANGLMYSQIKDIEEKAFNAKVVNNFPFQTSEFQGESGKGGGGC